MPILYQINGREVSREQFEDSLGERGMMGEIMQHVVDELSSQLDAVRCTEHNARPTVTTKYMDEGIGFDVAGCCADLKAKTEAVLRSIGGEQIG